MKYLIGFCCFFASIAAFGNDDGALENPGRDTAEAAGLGRDEESIVADDALQADPRNEVIVDAWQPRLILRLQTNVEEVSRTVLEAHRVPVGNRGESGIEYRERSVRVALSQPVESGVLYCDAVSIDVAKDVDNPAYVLECLDRIHLRVNGLLVNAESARFADGTCELVNAELIHERTKVTSQELTLTLPITGVVMNSFGRVISAPTAGAGGGRPLMPERDPRFSRELDTLDESQAESREPRFDNLTLPGAAASSEEKYRASDFLRAPGLGRAEQKPSTVFER